MRVLYQPTEATPADWQTVDSRDWGTLVTMDMHALCVQGLTFGGADHYAVRHLPSGAIQVFCWYDDPVDWPPGQRWARVTTVPLLTSDAAMGGAINTGFSDILYAEDGIRPTLAAAYRDHPRVIVLPWRDFAVPQAKRQDGLWVTDAQHAAHQGARTLRGWREWVEGLGPSELDDDGLVKPQRPQGRYVLASGTRTYVHRDTAGPDIHSAEHPNELLAATGSSATETATVNQNGQTAFSAVTGSGEPDSAAWPTTGDYRCQLDVTAVGADLAFGLLDQGNGTGHFGRVNSGATADQETFSQDQAAFTGTGLHLASVTDPSWTAGSASDRFETVVSALRTVGHGNQTLSLQLNEADDFADGPWAAKATGSAPFFSANF